MQSKKIGKILLPNSFYENYKTSMHYLVLKQVLMYMYTYLCRFHEFLMHQTIWICQEIFEGHEVKIPCNKTNWHSFFQHMVQTQHQRWKTLPKNMAQLMNNYSTYCQIFGPLLQILAFVLILHFRFQTDNRAICTRQQIKLVLNKKQDFFHLDFLI